MAKKRTEKCCYASRYAEDTWVTPAQYLCEFVCEKKAAMEGGELPQRFWNLKEWMAFFRSQVNTANKLLKEYHMKAIMDALKDFRTKKTYSLRAPWLLPIIKEYNVKRQLAEEQSSRTEEIPEIDPKAKPRPAQRDKNILDLLE